MNLWIVLIPSYISLVRCTGTLSPCSESAADSSTGCVSLSGPNDGSSGNNRTSVLIAYKSISITYYSTFEGKTKEFRVLLRRGTNNARTVCEGSFNSSYQPFQCSTDISCTVIPTNTSVTFNLMGLTEAHTDIYYFFKNNMYPPPYTCSRDNGTVIHVKTDEHLLSEPVPPTKPHVSQPSWPLLVMLIVSAVYSVFVTGALCYILRREEKPVSYRVNISTWSHDDPNITTPTPPPLYTHGLAEPCVSMDSSIHSSVTTSMNIRLERPYLVSQHGCRNWGG